MSDNRFKEGLKIIGPIWATGIMYIIPAAAKELKGHIKGDASFEQGFINLTATWTHSRDTHSLYTNGDMYKKISDGLYRVKKSGTQARLIGYSEGCNFFVMKCLKKKKDKIDERDIETAQNRKEYFNINEIKWEECKWEDL